MRFLKNILSFSIPLFIVLMTFSLYSLIVSIVNKYKTTIINDYAIVIVTSTPLIKNNIKTLASIDVKDIETLKREEIISNMKDQLSKPTLKLLKQKLPFFYKIHLNTYPTTIQLKQIRNRLSALSIIKRVETFSSDHSKVYSLLILYEKTISTLFFCLFIFTILILSKQISIWFFEHSQRISIIQYHGGSTLYSSLPIIKIATISSIFSSLLAILTSISIKNNLKDLLSEDILTIIPSLDSIHINYIQILFLAIAISCVSIIGILIKHKLK